ncbi:MAG: type II toxin-antitoxin system VapC family toxin [Bacteroidales bacterium]|nr:type II toxin-antitoxin system VapC family toxin [Bacteroidales bacterium]
MRLLLDTNIFVFLATDADYLSKDVFALIDDPDNQLYMSAESLKELIVAYRNKGLGGKRWKNEQHMLDTVEEEYNVTVLPITKEHMRTFAALQINEAQGHKDPSDHVIISHAITEGLTLISSDTRFPFYRKQGLELIENN